MKRIPENTTAIHRQQAGQSELEKENLNYVAAAPAQIKEVLIKDPGLLVELKRWIAREASDNGQVVSEEDLTDNAVFDRLTTDVVLRSVATRLVQRYGYLRPNFNPDSELGKEQELLLKERVRRQAQMEAQEDNEALQPKKTETAQTKTVPCDLEDPRDCAQEMPSRPERMTSSPDEIGPQRDVPPYYPNEGQPPNVSPRLMQTRGSNDGSFISQSGDSIESLLTASGPMKQPGDSRSSGIMPSDPLSSALMDQARQGALQSLGTGSSPDLAAASQAARSDMTGQPYLRRKTKLAADRTLAPGMPVHRPNPYADIPSLYDLYVQAPATDRPPQRFGSEVFRDGLRDPRSIPMDLPVGPDYVVGPGDSLTIDLWGGISTKLVRIVDRQGRVTLPEAGPVLVSGRSLGEVQQAVQRAVSTQYRDTSSDVTVSRLRTIRIYVVGEVEEPGAYDISSLSTALNALVGAGGVTPRGSLRSLKHMRGRQELEEIDTYDLLLHGVSPDAKKLENGDTLMVPPVGPQVTVTGMVRRPAIYELNGEETVEDALELAGGILPAAALRHVEVQRLEAHEKRTMLSLDLSPDNSAPAQLASFKIQEGDEIHIFPIAQYNQDTIYLQGHVQRPGRYSYHEQMKLTDLVASYKDILPEPAAHYGEIIRLNPPDFHPTVVSFDLASAMADPATGPALQPLDTVRIFSRFDFEPAPTIFVVGEVRSPGNYRTSGQASLRDAVFLAGGLKPDAALDTAQLFRINPDGSSKIFSVNLGSALSGNATDNILLQPRDRLLIHKNTSRVEPSTIEITGEVAKPGRYPYTENMRTEDLIRAAGGLKRSADTKAADLTRYAASGGSSQHLQISLASLSNGNASEDLPLHSGDVLAIRQVPGWSDIGAAVKVNGEVMHPSTYGIRPGEQLSSALQRAGGFTGQAYPYGAVLMRREVREMEIRNQAELISRMKVEREHLKELPEGSTEQRNNKLNAIAQTDAAITQLAANPPIGRVVIHIQSDVSKWRNTPADVALRDGDVLVIPKKANVVTVNGQVFNPTAISAQSGRSAKWYLSQAGGPTPIADKKDVFVIRADGSVLSAKSNGGGWFSGDPLNTPLRPGDAVMVPEKTPKIGGPNWQLIMQTAQVASSVALAVAYIHP
ncbi:MAG TPA: SLBB domain-containing protein [Candidatus Acidoferrales bacterium]|nr:SLBB domain-containing protein [Candidatus Acidoferrales bacterium]